MASSHRKPRSAGSRIAGIWTPADDGGDRNPGEVERKIDDLYRRADSAAEEHGTPKRTLKFNSARKKPGSFTATPDDHYDHAQLMSRLTARQKDAVAAHLRQRSTAAARPQESAAGGRVPDGTPSDLRTAKATVQKKLATAHALLSQPATPTRGQEAAALAKQAIAFARAQIGKPYVVGAAGPGSYDCSGLTQAAWKAAGVTLPRATGEQATAGPAVPLADAQPGDLVFFHDDVSHVGVYVGDGLMIHAPKPGAYVREESIHFESTATVHSVVRPA
ncbi:C40 family peptidase [Streptomyces sp. NPDC091280]|uniref:C40 family peptidase n=1 Tax=Streptomyces sp. NPDC091280 TaxID=3365984 RepID=UPI0037F8C497